jgi:long-chain acyl-CoA synthetase
MQAGREVTLSINSTINNPPVFWDEIHKWGNQLAIVDGRDGKCLSYRTLDAEVTAVTEHLVGAKRRLVYLVLAKDVDGIVCYLALLRARYTIHLASPNIGGHPVDRDFVRRYKPEILIFPQALNADGFRNDAYRSGATLRSYQLAVRTEELECPEIFPATTLLLSTSGSTGSAKVARLSERSIAVSAVQVAHALDISASARHVLSLPIHLAYGLSVLHGCLAVGASVVVGTRSIMERAFWRICQATSVTTLPAVPTMLSFMADIGVDKFWPPQITSITVSGAAMSSGIQQWLLTKLLAKGTQVYSMYGMTEAVSRVSVLPPAEFSERPHSVGTAVDGGRLQIQASGEIIYSGPNVMLGYATSRKDLQLGDENGGVLATGDIGEMDGNGNLRILGRISRVAKVLGVRLALDEIEASLGNFGEIAVVSDDMSITVFHTAENVDRLIDALDSCAIQLRIPRHLVRLRSIQKLPRTESAKIAYATLQQMS